MQKALIQSALLGGLIVTGLILKGSSDLQPNAQITENILPAPTQINPHSKDEGEMKEWREGYWEYIHSHGDEQTDWRTINNQNIEDKLERRKHLLNSKTVESYANNYIEAEWIERGSNDQAGNVRVCAYDKPSESIYAIGDGGILFKSDINGNSWQSLNDHFVLNRDILLSIRKPDNTVRLLGAVGHEIHYSDDEGQTWTPTTGFGSSASDFGRGIDIAQLNDNDSTIVYLYTFHDGFNNPENRIAYSKDHGESFTYLTDLNSTNDEFASMSWIEGFSTAYILDGNDDVYVFEDDTATLVTANMSLVGNSTCQIELSCDGVDTVLYILMNDEDLHKSTDAGQNFGYVASLPTPAWECGIGVSFDNPDAVYYGEVELYGSTDGGLNFTKVNEWYDYYNDVPNTVHADIMNIQTFKKTDGTEFTLIPNHGGINITYDEMATTPNIGLMNLNVGQFYDVATSPINSSYIIGGTQDQGLLRTGQGSANGLVGFEQVISGDYGQQQFSNNGQSFWTQYPGADFSYYSNAMTSPWAEYWHTIDGTDKPNYGWIVPTAPAGHPADDFILVGGGNINGGSGSYLIWLENIGGSANAFQFDVDFLALSGGMISAIETTPLNADNWFLATENGKFYSTQDGGNNWTEATSFTGPQNSWIYSSDIYASRNTPGLVFFGGRNYGGSPVYMSEDGGLTFTPINNGIPPTMVHEMCMDPDENFLFAATDAGPYVYVVEQNEWFDISGTDAPIQEYISCEYVAADDIVRFATWGRGIWDFEIVGGVVGQDELNIIEEDFGIYPNPSDGNMNIYSPYYAQANIYNIHGQKVLETIFLAGNNKVNLGFLKNGQYFLVGMDETGKVIKDQFIIRK
jgi:photosystem II stability/assembly factor-like uncharacterized protein